MAAALFVFPHCLQRYGPSCFTHPWQDQSISGCYITQSVTPSLISDVTAPNSYPAYSGGRCSGQASRVDLSSLEAGVAFYFAKGLATSSLKAYGSAARRFLQFCSQWGFNQPLPVDEELVCFYATSLAKEGLKHSTIKSYLSGLRYLQIAKGLPDPFISSGSHLHLDYIMHGIKRDQAESGFKAKPRLPVIPVILDCLQDHLLACSTQDDLMLWATACTSFLASSVRGNSCALLIRNTTLLFISPWQILPWTATEAPQSFGFGSSKARPTPFEQASMSSWVGQTALSRH